MISPKLWDKGERISNRLSKICRQNNCQKKVAFMHIPKCAGTSVMESLRRNRQSSWQGHVDGPKTRADYLKYFAGETNSLSRWEMEQCIYKYRQAILLEKFKQNAPIISGHVPFFKALKYDYPDYYFFTIVRNPIDRWISYFNFGIKRGLHENITPELITSKGISYVFDQVLDSESGFLEAHILSQFFSEPKGFEVSKMTTSSSMNLTMGMFDYIGHTENMDELRVVLCKEGIISENDLIGRHNSTRSEKYDSNIVSLHSLSSRQKFQLESLCANDCKLYQRYLT